MKEDQREAPTKYSSLGERLKVRGTFCEIVTIKDLSGLCSLGQDILDASMIIPPWLILDWFNPSITSLRQTPDLGSLTLSIYNMV